jgi:hypothetical protein
MTEINGVTEIVVEVRRIQVYDKEKDVMVDTWGAVTLYCEEALDNKSLILSPGDSAVFTKKFSTKG